MKKQVKILVSVVIALAAIGVIIIVVSGSSNKNKSQGQISEESQQGLSRKLQSSFNKNLVGKSSGHIRGLFGEPPANSTTKDEPSFLQWVYYDTGSNSYLVTFKDNVVTEIKVVPPDYKP